MLIRGATVELSKSGPFVVEVALVSSSFNCTACEVIVVLTPGTDKVVVPDKSSSVMEDFTVDGMTVVVGKEGSRVVLILR